MMDETEKDRRGLRLIQGIELPPRPEPASWPRRYRILRHRRSQHRPRSGRAPLTTRVEQGAVQVKAKGGSRRTRREKKYGRPPLRQLRREQRAKVLAATREELSKMVSDAWKKLFDVAREHGWRSPDEGCSPFLGIDPNG